MRSMLEHKHGDCQATFCAAAKITPATGTATRRAAHQNQVATQAARKPRCRVFVPAEPQVPDQRIASLCSALVNCCCAEISAHHRQVLLALAGWLSIGSNWVVRDL